MKKITLLLALVLWLPALPLTSHAAERVGPDFTDPEATTATRPGWKEQPLKYDFWGEGGDLAVTLDQHLYPALVPLISKYAEKHGIDIRVHEGTCGISAGILVRKQADMGGFCCPPSLEGRLPGLVFHTLGISALGILVHPGNQITDLSVQQVRDIFQGKTTYWSHLKLKGNTKGETRLIHPIGRLHCKKRPGHWRLILDNEDLFSTRLREVGTIKDMIGSVATDRGAIGYEVLWNLELHKREGKVKYITVDGASPQSEADLLSLKYPFYRTYNITTWRSDDTDSRLAGQLADFLVSQIDSLDPGYGIIPVSRVRKAGWKFKDQELIGSP